MDNTVKQRVIGAVVLVALAVIFVPMLLEQPDEDLGQVGGSLPDQPEQIVRDRIEPLTLPEPPPETEPVQVVLDEAPADPTLTDASVPATEPAPTAAAPTDAFVTEGVEIIAPLAEAPAVAAAPAPVTAPTVAAPAPAPAVATAPVPAPAEVAKPAAAPSSTSPSGWVVQLASLASKPNAVALQEKLRGLGYTAFVEEIKVSQSVLYRVRVGPELQRANAETLRNRLEQQLQIKGIVTRYP